MKNRFENADFNMWELSQIRKALVAVYTASGTDYKGEDYVDEWRDSGMQKCVQEITAEMKRRQAGGVQFYAP